MYFRNLDGSKPDYVKYAEKGFEWFKGGMGFKIGKPILNRDGSKPEPYNLKKEIKEFLKQTKVLFNKQNMLRILAISQSVILIVIIISILIYGLSQPNNKDGAGLLILIFLFVTQIINVTALLNKSPKFQKTWLGLYIERKKLEEIQRINSLTEKKK